MPGELIAGAAMGLGAANVVVKFARADYEQKIARFDAQIAKLNAHLDTLKTYKAEIPNFWDDDTGVNLANAVQTQINQVQAALNKVEDLKALFQTAMESLETSKTMVSSTVEEIKGMVEALSGLSDE